MLDSVERARQRRLEEEQRLEAERKARAAAKLAELDRRAKGKAQDADGPAESAGCVLGAD
jgi:hypothetical protein